MRVLILGAGVIGVTTAWELLRDGHEVTVLERNPGPAAEASLANAGLIAPGHAFAWASPKVPGILLKSLYRNDQAFRFRFRADPQFWRWTAAFLGQCTAERARANTLRKHRLCVYSQARLHEVVNATGVEYDADERGLLYLFRSQESLDRGAAHSKILADAGQPLEVIDRERVVAIDPGYGTVRDKIAGAVYCPTDGSGSSKKFTEALAANCRQMGAELVYDTEVRRLASGANGIERVITDGGEHSADVYVLALGAWSPLVVHDLGVRLPVYPVKGYSVTIPTGEDFLPPAIGAVDEDNLVAYVRLGDVVRATATAQFSGYDTAWRPSDFAAMLAAVKDLFPRGGHYDRAQYRACLRPMTPRGSPVLGRGAHANLYYNTGQGHMGWTMACGSARITADLIAGREPEIDIEGMRLGD